MASRKRKTCKRSISLYRKKEGEVMADEVLYEVEGRVAVVTLNRPAARNAINGAVAAAMNDIMHRIERDPNVWVTILTGAGDRAFSAGADLKAMASGEGQLLETQEGGFLRRLRALSPDQASDRCGPRPGA